MVRERCFWNRYRILCSYKPDMFALNIQIIFKNNELDERIDSSFAVVFRNRPYSVIRYKMTVTNGEWLRLLTEMKNSNRFIAKIKNWSFVLFGHSLVRTVEIRTIWMFVSAQTQINFIIVKDFLQSNLDSIKGSISVESIFSQTCSFMIAITAIHWPMTHCYNPWLYVTMLICLFQVSFDEFNFSGILWESQIKIGPWLSFSRSVDLDWSSNTWLDLEDVVYPMVDRHHNSRIRWYKIGNVLDPYQSLWSSKTCKN